MSTFATIAELSKMTASELRKDRLMALAEARKLRLGLEMQKEKNHASYRKLKKQIARMTMVLDNMPPEALMKAKKEPTIERPKTVKAAPKKKAKTSSSSK